MSTNYIGTIAFCIVSYNYFWPNLLVLIWLYCLQEIIFNKFSKIFLSLSETYYFSSIK